MNRETAERLLLLNKQFYQTFGAEFAATRGRLQPGVRRILDRLNGDESILDLGCGNGEMARELIRRGHCGHYLGVDFSLPLLEAARQGMDERITFLQADLLSADWDKRVTEQFSQPIDQVTALAVLHHIPGDPARLDILKKIHELLRRGGLFIHSEWQFLRSEKLKDRIHPWDEARIPPEAVDPNDYLLDWRHGGRGLRYIHHFDEAELASLASASHFRIRETFSSDGANARLGLYQIWEAV